MRKVRPRARPGTRRLDWPAHLSIWGSHFAVSRGRKPRCKRESPAIRLLQFPLPDRMKLVSIPANPVPDGATVGTVKTSDGALLRFARFDPPAGRKGTLVVLQGRAEFIEKYFEVVHDARARGFAVAMLDWRGQGLSERALSNARKGHIYDFAEYDRDLEAFVKEIVLPDCPAPLFA